MIEEYLLSVSYIWRIDQEAVGAVRRQRSVQLNKAAYYECAKWNDSVSLIISIA